MKGGSTTRFAAIVLTLALIVSALTLPSGAVGAHHRWERCGTAGYSGQVRAHRVRCPYARHVINKFIRESQSRGARFKVLGFKCHGKTVGRHVLVKCHRGLRHRVRWYGYLSP